MNQIKILLIVFFFSTAYSQTIHNNFVWKSYTFKGEVLDFTLDGGKVWCATSGGIFSADLDDRTITEFSNTEGLMSNNLVALEKDDANNIWFAFREKGYWPSIHIFFHYYKNSRARIRGQRKY